MAEQPQENVSEDSDHPSLMESLTIIGASLTFVEDNWDEFTKAMEFADVDNEIKARMLKQLIHLKNDIGAHIARQELLESVIDKFARIFDI